MLGGGGKFQYAVYRGSVTVGNLTEHDPRGVYVPGEGLGGFFPFGFAGTLSDQFFHDKVVTLDFVSMTLVVASS